MKVLAGQTDHRGHPAGADGGRDPGDHRRHPDPAAGAPRRGDHQAADRRRVRRRTCRSTGSTRSWRCSRASWPPTPTATSPSAAAATTQNATYIDGVPVQAGYRGTSRALFQSLRAGHPDRGRHERLRRGVGDHGRLLGRVRQRAVRRHLGRHPDGRHQVQRDAVLRDRRGHRRNNSLGFNRVSGGFGGPARAGRLTFFSVRRRSRASSPSTTGQDGQNLADLRRRRASTRVGGRFPRALDDPTADTTLVPVYKSFARVTGRLQQLLPSSAELRASPATTASTARASGCRRRPGPRTSASAKLNYTLRHRLADLASPALRSQFQGRFTGSDLGCGYLDTTG